MQGTNESEEDEEKKEWGVNRGYCRVVNRWVESMVQMDQGLGQVRRSESGQATL